MKSNKSNLPFATTAVALATSAAAAFTTLAIPVEATAGQATVCIGNVCQSGSGSVSVRPTTVYSNGRDTYVNGQRFDPRNPAPLTNPGWRPASPQYNAPANDYPRKSMPSSNSYTAQRYSSAPTTRPSYNLVLEPREGNLVCKLGVQMTTTFNRNSTNIDSMQYSDLDFASVSAFQNMRSALIGYRFLAIQKFDPEKCGPKTGGALAEFIDKNPSSVIVTEENGKYGIILDLDLDQKYDPAIDAKLDYSMN